jgi:anti-sigma-K factor RskA
MDVQNPPFHKTAEIDCAELLLLIPEYSIGVASSEEMVLIERNLDRCPELAAELAAYSQVADTLLHSSRFTNAPPAVLDRLMAQIETEQPPIPNTNVVGPSVTADAINRVPTKSDSLPYTSIQNQQVITLTRWLAAAVALLIISNGFWAVMFTRQQAVPPAPAVFEAADTTWIELPSVSELPASALVVWSPSSGKAVLLANNFPAQPADMGYQAWLRRDGELYSLGVFQVGEDGSGTLELEAALLDGPITSMGITPEPVGGSPGPTGSAIVRLQM